MPRPDESPEVTEADATEMRVEPIWTETIGADPILAPPIQAQAIVPHVEPGDLVKRLEAIKETASRAMEENVDFGKIPGTDKPTLLKPGAEKLAVLFKLDPEPENEKRWEENGHLTVVSRTTLYDKESGVRCGTGEAICSTREKKYAKRQAGRKCPVCSKEAIIKGKAEYGGGWICFKKKGGCGEKFPEDQPAIVQQEVGEIDNPDLPDTWNTIDKMASKRSLVAAVLIVTGASAIFTQDLDEQVDAAATSPAFALATGEQSTRLSKALSYLLPPDDQQEAKRAIIGAFNGELYGPAAEAVCAVIRAHKANVDAESMEAQEALNAERDASDG